jgi:hypothetical protein
MDPPADAHKAEVQRTIFDALLLECVLVGWGKNCSFVQGVSTGKDCMDLEPLPGDRLKEAVWQAATMLEAPQNKERLQAAMDFVLTRAVALHDDGSATVTSGDNAYELDPQKGCPCSDAKHRTKQCKHVLAVELFKRVQILLAQPGGADPPPEPPRSASWQVHEAPASCCLKFLLGGVECMYTMRDTDDEKLFARVRRLLPKVLQKVSSNGQKGSSGESNGADPSRCAIHNASMKRHTKGDQVWYSHKAPDGSWCRGK